MLLVATENMNGIYLYYDIFRFERWADINDEMKTTLTVLLAEDGNTDLVLGRRVWTTCCWTTGR